ncbi:unnamed protein product [Rangifer tarandus platyrhynchus]|uniref:Uncharacterized protein n=1 Tax=Rangifer tarandus platyrhynchus TaxID=3082113 RepID=A0ABN8ZHG7_RANTA|nr:unnamed protein product [Rangifer tarandus platyrhynchus]
METDSGQLQQKGVERSSLSEEPDALELSQSFARISLQSDEGAPGPPALWGRGGGGARRDHVRTTWRTPSPRAVPDPGDRQWASPLHSSNKQVLLQCSDLPRIKCSDYEGDCAVPAKLATPLIISECPGALEMAVQDGN